MSQPSYLADGRISPALVAEMFRHAGAVYRAAPWAAVFDSQLVRVDIPAFGITGAALCTIGNLGESFGLLLFPSLAAYDAFVDGRPQIGPGPGESILSLNFERASVLPARMRREIATHGWPVEGDSAYPLLLKMGDGSQIGQRETHLWSLLCAAFTDFFLTNRGLFEGDEVEPVCRSYDVDAVGEIRLTAPYDDVEIFAVNCEADRLAGRHSGGATPLRLVQSGPKVGRNDPCPCGSGKKFKKCCVDKRAEGPSPATPPTQATVPGRARLHDRINAMATRLGDFAMARFGQRWIVNDFLSPEYATSLLNDYMMITREIDGKSILEHFATGPNTTLSAAESALLEAHRLSWFSIWEVLAVAPEAGLTLRDLLSGEERVVHDVSASRSLVLRDCVLARILELDGETVFSGLYARSLSPTGAAVVLDEVRRKLRKKKSVAPERLRDPKVAHMLIESWETAVADHDLMRSIPPRLQNTDGDDLLLTTDRFSFDASQRDAVATALRRVEGVESDSEDERAFTISKPGNSKHTDWDNTVLAHVELGASDLRVNTNSVKRANRIRKRLEAALGPLVVFKIRDHQDPTSGFAASRDGSKKAFRPAQPEEFLAVAREFKARHYQAWMDTEVPALGGQTPRQAARRVSSRKQVELLLRDIENREARLPEAERFDFAPIRAELGVS